MGPMNGLNAYERQNRTNGAAMSIPRSVAEVPREHVTLELESIDRMYLNVYLPQLQREGGVASFFRFHLGHQYSGPRISDQAIS